LNNHKIDWKCDYKKSGYQVAIDNYFPVSTLDISVDSAYYVVIS